MTVYCDESIMTLLSPHKNEWKTNVVCMFTFIFCSHTYIYTWKLAEREPQTKCPQITTKQCRCLIVHITQTHTHTTNLWKTLYFRVSLCLSFGCFDFSNSKFFLLLVLFNEDFVFLFLFFLNLCSINIEMLFAHSGFTARNPYNVHCLFLR